MMSDSDSSIVETLADEFAERLRRGESPSISEYADAHPECADEIRELFPSVQMIEQLACRREQQRMAKKAGTETTCPDPEQLGDYRIVRRIGQGGMGIVYEAVHQSLDRRVAVKMLPPQMALTDRYVTRFVREAKAAARLHHTNIVPVFGVGEDQGMHFYVMQLIDGQGLDGMLDQVRAQTSHGDGRTTTVFEGSANCADSMRQVELADAPDSLPIGTDLPDTHFRRVAQIGVRVARALEYAHAHGVLHRDVKPANILVDEEDNVWVTDFGLAKFIDANDATASGDVVGTLRYIAPESFQGEVDARSDIYGLGLTLYELLALRPAFEEQEQSPLLQRIMAQEPPRLRNLIANVPRDLETIVSKAMAKEPPLRYPSAGELADDLQRFLDDCPIRARHVTSIERLWRWSRRNPVLASLGVTCAVLLLVIATVSSFGYLQLRKAYDQVGQSLEDVRRSEAKAVAAAREAELQRDLVKKEYQRAETNLTQAIAALDAIFDQVAARDLPQSIRQADEDGDIAPIGGGLTADDAELLQSLLKFYEEFARTNQSSAALNVELAAAHKKVGDILARLGQYDQAGSAFQNALRVYESLMAKTPDCVAYVLATADVHNAVGRVLALGGELGRAKDAQFAAVALLESLPPEEADSARVRFALAQSWSLLVAVRAQELVAFRRNPEKNVARPRAGGASRRDRPKGASRKPDSSPPAPRKRRDLAHPPPWLEDGFQQALALLGQLVAEEPDNPNYRLALARCYRSMLPAAWHEKDQAQATEMKQQAIDILDDLVATHPDRAIYAYELADTLAMTAPVTAQTSLPPDDVDHLDRAVELARQLTRRYPTSHPYKALLAGALAKLAAHHAATDAFENAASNFEDCILLLRSLREQASGNQVYLQALGRASRDYGELLREKKSLDRSRSVLKEAIAEYEAYRKTPGARRPSTRLLVTLYHSLSATLTQLGEDQLATEARRNADLLRGAASKR